MLPQKILPRFAMNLSRYSPISSSIRKSAFFVEGSIALDPRLAMHPTLRAGQELRGAIFQGPRQR